MEVIVNITEINKVLPRMNALFSPNIFTATAAEDWPKHPMLSQAVANLRLSERFGSAAYGHCLEKETLFYPISRKNLDARSVLAFAMTNRIYGSADTPTEATVLAHEARHIWQHHNTDVFKTLGRAPLATHVIRTMMEADAYTFAAFCAFDLWRIKKILPQDIDPSLAGLTELHYPEVYYAQFLKHHDNPDVVLGLANLVFDELYCSVSASSHYQGKYREESAEFYNELKKFPYFYDKRTVNSAGGALAHAFLAANTYTNQTSIYVSGAFASCALGLAALAIIRRNLMSKALLDTESPERSIDHVAKQLGRLPGIGGNYITLDHGKDVAGHYISMLNSESRRVHETGYINLGKPVPACLKDCELITP